MANFKIMRNGLNTEIVGDPHIGQSSEDVTVTVTDDGTYQGYDKKLYYSYGYRNQVYRAIADKNANSEFIIPMTAFLEPGIVKLSLELSNGTNKPTCNACFIIATDGAKSVAASDILPDEETWQSYIQSYIKSNAEEFKGDTGAQGEKGEKGEKGDTGEIGPQGPQGEKGDTGPQGPQGPKGDTGDSDYKPAVDALGKRIDESSAEVIDARTGYDGTTYDTLGTAIRTQVNNLNNDLANTASVTFTYDPSKIHSSTVDKINLSTKKGELYTLYVTNDKGLTSNLSVTVYEYNGKTGNPKEEQLPFFSAHSFVSNGCDSVGIWMAQNMFAESCEVTFTMKRELYEKTEDIYNKINCFSQCTDSLYIPSVVNGTVRNVANKAGISTSEIIPTNGAKTIKVYTTIPLQNGYHYHYNLATYKNGGNPREETKVNFVDGYVKTQDNPATFDVSGFDYFAFDLFIVDNSIDYNLPIRMSNNIVEKPFLIGYEYQIDKFAMSDEIIKMEHGIIVGGKYPTYANKQYIRSKSIMKVNRGDCLTIDVSDKLSGGYQYNLYKYSNTDENSVIENQVINNVSNPEPKTIHFGENCYISIRATLVPVHDLTDEEANIFMKLFSIRRNVVYSDIDELHSSVNAMKKQVTGYDGFLNIDYNTLKTEMDGNINIAVQTDTHMCAFDTYKNDGTKVYPSDFENFRMALNTIEKLGCDATTNLGDIVQGYEFDADFETRECLKKIMQTYSETLTQKPLYVIGNHDDGNLFYYDTSYNDKKDVSNVLYPYEQFQRITKNGVNGKNNKNYYYADIKGIRFITLYQRDFDYSEKIPSIEEFCISQTQIDWFKNDALNTTNPIIVLTHAPLVSELFTTGGTGFAEILTALQTFKSNGGIVIAVLSGHTHKQDQAVVDGINHIVFANGYSFFEIMSVNLNTKTIKCKPINNSTLQERTFSY